MALGAKAPEGSGRLQETDAYIASSGYLAAIAAKL
jgi:hypothetical protein